LAKVRRMSSLERFRGVMEYASVDSVPNYELGVWQQTRERWLSEGLAGRTFTWDWFTGERMLGLDHREYIPVNFDMIPPFKYEVLEETDRYEIIRNTKGMVTRALKVGTIRGQRMSMDQYIGFPVQTRDDFKKLKQRYRAGSDARYPSGWENREEWQTRDHPLVLGQNCAAGGFYWRAREWMGTENLSYAWYDQPELMHEMMEFYADFTIEVCRPLVERVNVDYFNLNEDLAMKTGPLLSPETFRMFIYPHLCRLVEFLKSNGVSYIIMDSDGNFDVLIPLLMDAGVDCVWPLERAAGMDPFELRKKYGKDLRLWGGVDKRVLALGKRDIASHLASFLPLIEEGGFIPHIDHTVPPDISLENFMYYMKKKKELLAGIDPTG